MIFGTINNTLLFSLVTFVYMIFFAVAYFLKKKVKSIELSIFNKLIICNILSLITELSLIFFILCDRTFLNIVLKIYNICLFTYVWLFGLYSYYISKNKNKRNRQAFKYRLYLLFYLISCIIILILPVYLNDVDYKQYSYGPSVTFLFFIVGLLVILISILLLANIKNIKEKKAMPIIMLILFLASNAIIQFLWPHILLANSFFSLTTFAMYFTIENPDVKMINELNIAKGEAERANNAKTEFLANMSHEIRTPLNAITGFSQALSEEEGMPEAAKEDIKDIMMASNSLLEIVNGVLDISKIEANKMEIINKQYEPRDIFEELESLTKVRIGEKPIEFRTYIDATIPKKLYGDHVRIKQIILNLLTNAAKYTEEGHIDFKVSSVIKGDICRLIISVEDTGIGIQNEKIDKLFTKFDRLDEERNITIEGTGLGLAITKKLLELMNGKITVQSVYGQGSKFTAYIDQKIVNEEDVVYKKEDVVTVDNIEVLTDNVIKKNILVVDDNKLNLKVAEKLLAKYPVNVTKVLSGFECIDLISKKEKYDLILMDDMMPKMDGKETLKKLKENKDFNIPVIALTANALSGMKEEYLSLGFNDYLAKPIEKAELERILKKYLDINL